MCFSSSYNCVEWWFSWWCYCCTNIVQYSNHFKMYIFLCSVLLTVLMLNPLGWIFVEKSHIFSKLFVFGFFPLFFFNNLRLPQIESSICTNFKFATNKRGKNNNNTQKHMKNGPFSIVIFPPSSSSFFLFFFFFFFTFFHYSQIVGFNFNIHKRCVMLMIIEKWFILCKIICYKGSHNWGERERESKKKFQ